MCWSSWSRCRPRTPVPLSTHDAPRPADRRRRPDHLELGAQNASPIEDRLGYLALYKQLGVGIIQLTYNTQNLIGSGCYESRDSGLSDFGREVVAEKGSPGTTATRPLTEFGEIKNPKGIERIEETPNFTAALERRGWKPGRIEKVMGLNWINYLKRVWRE